jgi:phage portal protein BeeE
MIHFRAVNRWSEDAFDEGAKPSVALSSEAEKITGATNEGLTHCRPTSLVLDDFLAFLNE